MPSLMMTDYRAEEEQRRRSPLGGGSIRKAISLAAIFRTEKSCNSSSPPSSYHAMSTAPSARIKKRVSLRRTLALASSPTSSTCSSPTGSQSSVLTPGHTVPQRPICPAPPLDLSCDHDEGEGNYKWTLGEKQSGDVYHTRVLQRLALRCPSEESFQCRGLEWEQREATGLHMRPTHTAVLQLPRKLQAQPSLTSLDSDQPSFSSASSIISFEDSVEDNEGERGNEASFSFASRWHDPVRQEDKDADWFCPPSPPAKIRLQLTLPPSANLCPFLTLYVPSNCSTLELKETVCSTLWQRFRYSISPSSLAFSVIQIDGQAATTLENDRPLYQEGLQDDDEIVVRF